MCSTDYKKKLRLLCHILQPLSDLTATCLSIHFLVSSVNLTQFSRAPREKNDLVFNPETGFRPSECFPPGAQASDCCDTYFCSLKALLSYANINTLCIVFSSLTYVSVLLLSLYSADCLSSIVSHL